jgi:hypothetical protein
MFAPGPNPCPALVTQSQEHPDTLPHDRLLRPATHQTCTHERACQPADPTLLSLHVVYRQRVLVSSARCPFLLYNTGTRRDAIAQYTGTHGRLSRPAQTDMQKTNTSLYIKHLGTWDATLPAAHNHQLLAVDLLCAQRVRGFPTC